MSVQTISRVIPSAISLPGSADGALRCSGQELLQIDLFGQAPAPAKISVAPAKEKASAVIAIYGRISLGSSASAALSESLASRLKLRLDTVGSTVYRQTWKRKVTPLGRSYWAHTARVPTTNGKGCTGWPTPTLVDVNHSRCACPMEYSTRQLNRKNARFQLADVAQANLAGWTTPTVSDHNGAPATEEGWHRKDNGNLRNDTLKCQASLVISGQTQSPTSAKTENGGVLNPAFSRWLQGYPYAWDTAAILAYRSKVR